jgi:hypothetical protein
MIHIPFDIFHLICTFIPFCKKNWLNIKLSSKLFKKIVDRAFIPTYFHFKKAAKDLNLFSLKNILSYNNIDPFHFNNAIENAYYYGNAEIVQLLL